MRKVNQLLNVMLLAGAILYSCSDDEHGYSADRQVSFYGEVYSLGTGAIYHDNNHTVIAVEDYVFEDRYEVDGTEKIDLIEGTAAKVGARQTGNFLLGLYEDSFVVSDYTQDARGEGACVCLRVASSEIDQLVPGKYTYSPNHEENTFTGYSAVSWNPSADENSINELTEGDVEITQEGDIYTVTFNCKTSFGGTIQGKYVGKLKEFDIRKEFGEARTLEEIELEALFDKVVYTGTDGVEHSEPDYLRAKSFLNTSTGVIYTANEYRNLSVAEKKAIDIALAYDKEKEEIYFLSPIAGRSLLWHNMYESETLFDYSFDLPCHTRYMPVPENFTNEDFEELALQEDFNFDFEEAMSSFPVESPSLPCFFVVQTGNGQVGVVRVREVTPESTEMINGVTYPKNPFVIMDIKFSSNSSEEKIR